MRFLTRVFLTVIFLSSGSGWAQEPQAIGGDLSAQETMRLRHEKMRLGSQDSGKRLATDKAFLNSVEPLYIDGDPVFQNWVLNIEPTQNLQLEFSNTSATIHSSERIRSIGGNRARIDQLTHVTALLLGNNRPVCSATAITRKHFLTAAHCFCGPSKPVTLAFGRDTRDTSLKRTFGTKFRLVDGATGMDCSDYESKRKTIAGSDLAIIELNGEVGELYLKFPAKLATVDEIESLERGTNALIAGFGRRSTRKDSRLFRIGVKNYLISPIVDVRCSGSRYDCVKGQEVITRDTRQGGLGPCSGDSGGAMFVLTNRASGPTYVLAGVVSRMARSDLRCGDAVAFTLLSHKNRKQIEELLND